MKSTFTAAPSAKGAAGRAAPVLLGWYIAHRAVSTTCPHPLENPSQLLEELKEIRREGRPITVGDYTDGAVGISAPVFGPDGPAVASLGIVCPAARGKPRAAERPSAPGRRRTEHQPGRQSPLAVTPVSYHNNPQ